MQEYEKEIGRSVEEEQAHAKALREAREKIHRIKKRYESAASEFVCARCGETWNVECPEEFVDHTIVCSIPFERDTLGSAFQCPLCTRFFQIEDTMSIVQHVRDCVRKTDLERKQEALRMTKEEVEALDYTLQAVQRRKERDQAKMKRYTRMQSDYERYRAYMDEHAASGMGAGEFARANYERYGIPYITMYKHLDRRLNRRFLTRWLEERKENNG